MLCADVDNSSSGLALISDSRAYVGNLKGLSSLHFIFFGNKTHSVEICTYGPQIRIFLQSVVLNQCSVKIRSSSY